MGRHTATTPNYGRPIRRGWGGAQGMGIPCRVRYGGGNDHLGVPKQSPKRSQGNSRVTCPVARTACGYLTGGQSRGRRASAPTPRLPNLSKKTDWGPGQSSTRATIRNRRRPVVLPPERSFWVSQWARSASDVPHTLPERAPLSPHCGGRSVGVASLTLHVWG